jgi:hypothetical protein
MLNLAIIDIFIFLPNIVDVMIVEFLVEDPYSNIYEVLLFSELLIEIKMFSVLLREISSSNNKTF